MENSRSSIGLWHGLGVHAVMATEAMATELMATEANPSSMDGSHIPVDSPADSIEQLNSVRERVSHCIGDDRMALWFGEDSKWSVDASELSITVSNEFLADCIRSFCMKDLRSVANELIGHHASVQIHFDSTVSKPSKTESLKKIAKPSPSASTVRTPQPALQEGMAHGPTEQKLGARGEKDTGIGKGPTKIGGELKVFAGEGSKSPAEEASSVYRGNSARRESEPRVATPGSRESSTGMKVDYWSEFIESPSNKLARTAAVMVIERPGSLTPVLIHGPTGVGKSHLARGISDQLRVQHRLRRVIYLTAEQFTIDFTDSARGSGFASFRKKYRDIDALILDDVHFLLGKGGTLLELRNTIDNLIRNQRQVILVSDRSLNELSGLGSELHARMSGGMVCSLEPLDEQGRALLLAKLAKRHSVVLDDETIYSLARSASGDARILHGLTFRLLTAQRSKGRTLTRDEAFESSRDLLRASQPVVRMSDIEKAVCDVFGLEPKSLQTKSKSKTISQPRMLAMFLARKYTRAAYSEIGDYFGNRQHSTVISAQKKVEDWLERNESVDHSRGAVGVRDMLRNLEATLQVG